MITFTLLVVLLMPNGNGHAYNLGDGMTREKCELRRAHIYPDQLIAKVISIDCIAKEVTQ